MILETIANSRPTRGLLILALASCLSIASQGQAQQPNIVLVMADDQGWGQVGEFPERFERMKSQAIAAIDSIDASVSGADYPEYRVLQPMRNEFWHTMEAYRPHFQRFFKRPEYAGYERKVPESLK